MAHSCTNTEADSATKWNNKYQPGINTITAADLVPAEILQTFQHLLPAQGLALDLACGLGGNALFLAQHKLQTEAWDISSVAIKKLNEIATSLALPINAAVRDIIDKPPPKNSFDVIVVSHFLDRQIIPAISTALRHKGLLFYQTFTKKRQPDSPGPSNEKYRLGKNELLNLFKEQLDIVIYSEEGLVINSQHTMHNQALLIGRRNSDNTNQ